MVSYPDSMVDSRNTTSKLSQVRRQIVPITGWRWVAYPVKHTKKA